MVLTMILVSIFVSRNSQKDELGTNPFLERKFIIHEKKLEELLSVCRQCSNPSITTIDECHIEVKFITICQDSSCGHHYSWTSQPHSFRLPKCSTFDKYTNTHVSQIVHLVYWNP